MRLECRRRWERNTTVGAHAWTELEGASARGLRRRRPCSGGAGARGSRASRRRGGGGRARPCDERECHHGRPHAAGAPSFAPLFEKTPWDRRGPWEASWVGCADAGGPPLVTAYRLRFDWPVAGDRRLRVSADERYELFLDGQRIGRGRERGNPEHWFYETYDVALPPGAHVLVARVFSLGPLAPSRSSTSGRRSCSPPRATRRSAWRRASRRGRPSACRATPSSRRSTSGASRRR